MTQSLDSSVWRMAPGSGAAHARIIQHAVDECSSKGGGRVVLEPGTHHCGTIQLRSGVTLHLEKNAVLLGSPDVNDYLRRSGNPGARLRGGENSTALIYAEQARQIALTGEGILDGNGGAYFVKKEKKDIPEWVEEKKAFGVWIPGFENGLRGEERPRALVLFVDCKDVRIELAHVRNSPAWTIHLLACTGAVLRGITLRGALNGSNTDGIDIDACSDVLVEDCDVMTGDDAVCLKNTDMWGLRRPSRNITVRRCRLCSTTHGFTIGTETQRDFEDIVLEDSTIGPAEGYRTLTGIGLSTIDGAVIRRLSIRNVDVTDAVSPLQIRIANAGRGQEIPVPGSMEDILLENVAFRGALGNCLLAGLPGHPLKNIILRGVTVEFAGTADPDKILKVVPELDMEFPLNQAWCYLPAFGFYCRHVDGLEFSGVAISRVVEDSRPALLLKNVTGLKMTGVNLGE